MAGGIDWFRWHHGSVTDPKFQLVAKKANVRTSDVIAIWAFLLEKASAAEFRSNFGDIDCEAVDCLFGLDEGSTDAVMCELTNRQLIAEGFIVAWEKRQPQRERPADASNDRVKAFRAKKNHVTPCNAIDDQKKPRVEESREEEIKTKEKIARKRATPLPEAFAISPRVQAWAAEKGHDRLNFRLEHFVSYAKRSGKTYVDWDEAFMSAIRENWAKLPESKSGGSADWIGEDFDPMAAARRREFAA